MVLVPEGDQFGFAHLGLLVELDLLDGDLPFEVFFSPVVNSGVRSLHHGACTHVADLLAESWTAADVAAGLADGSLHTDYCAVGQWTRVRSLEPGLPPVSLRRSDAEVVRWLYGADHRVTAGDDFSVQALVQARHEMVLAAPEGASGAASAAVAARRAALVAEADALRASPEYAEVVLSMTGPCLFTLGRLIGHLWLGWDTFRDVEELLLAALIDAGVLPTSGEEDAAAAKAAAAAVGDELVWVAAPLLTRRSSSLLTWCDRFAFTDVVRLEDEEPVGVCRLPVKLLMRDLYAENVPLFVEPGNGGDGGGFTAETVARAYTLCADDPTRVAATAAALVAVEGSPVPA